MLKLFPVAAMVSLAISALADGPADNLADNVRRIPPPGLAISETDRAELGERAATLRREDPGVARRTGKQARTARPAAGWRVAVPDSPARAGQTASLFPHFTGDDFLMFGGTLPLGRQQLLQSSDDWCLLAGPESMQHSWDWKVPGPCSDFATASRCSRAG